MDLPSWDYEAFADRVAEWATTRSDIRLVVVFGSRARQDRPADVWSDIDLALVTTDPDRYLQQSEWLTELGTPLLSCTEETPVVALTERHVLFEDGLEADFVPVPVDTVTPLEEAPDGLFAVLANGFRVLEDKDGLEPALSERVDAVRADQGMELPDQETFVETVHHCLYRAFWVGKKLRRGELWTAVSGLEVKLKQTALLPMIRWHARAVHGRRGWHAGRFLEEWADRRVVEKLPRTITEYEETDCWRALFETVALFRWLASETADAAGYDYPTTTDERVSALLEHLRPAS